MAHSIALGFVKSGGYCMTYLSQRLRFLSYQLPNDLQSKGPTVTPVRHNSQHRVVLLPEIPPDNPSTNPILKLFDENTDVNATDVSKKIIHLPDYKSITEHITFYAKKKYNKK